MKFFKIIYLYTIPSHSPITFPLPFFLLYYPTSLPFHLPPPLLPSIISGKSVTFSEPRDQISWIARHGSTMSLKPQPAHKRSGWTNSARFIKSGPWINDIWIKLVVPGEVCPEQLSLRTPCHLSFHCFNFFLLHRGFNSFFFHISQPPHLTPSFIKF